MFNTSYNEAQKQKQDPSGKTEGFCVIIGKYFKITYSFKCFLHQNKEIHI